MARKAIDRLYGIARKLLFVIGIYYAVQWYFDLVDRNSPAASGAVNETAGAYGEKVEHLIEPDEVAIVATQSTVDRLADHVQEDETIEDTLSRLLDLQEDVDKGGESHGG